MCVLCFSLSGLPGMLLLLPNLPSLTFMFLQMPLNTSRLTLINSQQPFAVGCFQWWQGILCRCLISHRLDRWVAVMVMGRVGTGDDWQLGMIIYAG